MALSDLQRYILRTAYTHARGRLPRTVCQGFYQRRPRPRNDVEILSRSFDRLIDRGYLIGYGHRTATKWFIESVRLTPSGRRAAKKLLGVQTRLPLH